MSTSRLRVQTPSLKYLQRRTYSDDPANLKLHPIIPMASLGEQLDYGLPGFGRRQVNQGLPYLLGLDSGLCSDDLCYGTVIVYIGGT
jgi:hypothetical protein